MSEPMLDAAGRRRSPATLPDFHAGRPPRTKGMRYPADPPTVEEIVAGMRSAVPYGSAVQPSRDETVTSGGISLPRITVPRATGGGISPSGPPSGMSIR